MDIGTTFRPGISEALSNRGRRLRLDELNKSLGISRGQIQPWELPEAKPLVEANKAETARTLSSVPQALSRSGVTGPAAALAVEKVAGGGTDRLFNVFNQLRAEKTGQGLGQAMNEEQIYQNLSSQDLQKAGLDLNERQFEEQMEAREKEQKWNKIMQLLKLGGSVGMGIATGGMSSLAGSASQGLQGLGYYSPNFRGGETDPYAWAKYY
jgi:hypothetical protein